MRNTYIYIYTVFDLIISQKLIMSGRFSSTRLGGGGTFMYMCEYFQDGSMTDTSLAVSL